jgi:hypothetical protein
MMEEVVVISEGCQMLDGVDAVGGALLPRLGHLCGGMLRLTGDEMIISELFSLEFSFTFLLLTQCFIYDYHTYGTLLVR